MSWADAVVDIAERMEKAGDSYDGDNGGELALSLGHFARELRITVKAAGGSSPFQVGDKPFLMGKAKEDEFQVKIKEQAQKEEAIGEVMSELIGGPLEGDSILRPAGMPFGAKTNIAGSIYELKDDFRLHHVPK